MKQVRTKLTGIILGLLGTLLAGFGFYSGGYERLERLSLDFRFRHFNQSLKDSRQIAVIAIDDGSLANVCDWPWPRTHVAKMIKLLNDLESREILVDLVLSMPKSGARSAAGDETEKSEDDLLAQACREHGRVTLATYYSPDPTNPAVVNALMANLKADADEIARKTGLPLATVQASYASCKRKAFRRLVADLLSRNPKLEKYQVVEKILGPQQDISYELRQVIEWNYNSFQAYREVQRRFGWSIQGEHLRPPIRTFSEPQQMVVPTTALAAGCEDVGFVNFKPDPDGKVREIDLLAWYDGLIYRQLALAGICQHWQVEPGKFMILSNGVELHGDNMPNADRKSIVLTGPKPAGIRIPTTRNGRMIINWYAPKRDTWEKSFSNIIPASRLLEIAFRQEALRKNRELLADAMPLTVKQCLPDRYEAYLKLTKRLPLLKESVENPPPASQPDQTDGATEPLTSLTASQPATSTSPTSVEEDLITTYRQTLDEVKAIETQARQQLQWLYEQLAQLSPEEKNREENILIHDLWKCLNAPREIREINAKLEKTINAKINEIYPLVRDRIILIGSTASTQGDFVPTPVFERCPGVLVHANVLNQILEKAFFTPADRNGDLLVILVIGTLMSILSAQRSAFEGLLWMALLLAGFFFFTCNIVFARLHVVSSMIGPMLAIILSWSLVSFYRQITEGKAKRVFASRLSQYTSPALARRIAEQPEGLEILPEQRQVTCFFSDIAGFTPLSEKIGPQGTVEFLNIYLEHMSEVLDRHEAFVNKFLADGIFAFFNPPLHNQDDHARRACLAAIASCDTLPHVRRHLTERFGALTESLRIRIGISTGKAVVGDCGSRRKFDYTCLGDTVNLASRLESANKFFGTEILICDRTFRDMGEDLLARPLGKIRVVGRNQAVVVYELIGYRQDHGDQLEYIDRFGQMVHAWWQSKFDQARSLLDELHARRPNDPAVKVYRSALEKITRLGPSAFRDGVIEIESK